MFSKDRKDKKDNKGKGKEGKFTGGSSKPTKDELASAASTLAWALETIGVTKYGFIGGAVSIIASHYGMRVRQTNDLDLIIQPGSTSAEQVSNSLTSNENVKAYFVSKREDYVDKPHVAVARGEESIHIPIEIFDWQVWPHRQQYYNLDSDGNAVQYLPVNDRQVAVLNPGWLLRQKILAYAQRQAKSHSDMSDIHLLKDVLAQRSETISIVDTTKVEALKVVHNAADAPDLKGYVLCEAIWPTDWTWDEKRKDYYKYNELWKKVWGKDFQQD